MSDPYGGTLLDQIEGLTVIVLEDSSDERSEEQRQRRSITTEQRKRQRRDELLVYSVRNDGRTVQLRSKSTIFDDSEKMWIKHLVEVQ